MLLIFVGLLLLGYLYFVRGQEGFATQGTTPAANQTSAITTDTPGATTTNPTASKPAAKDIEDIQERLKNFMLLVEQKLPDDTDLAPKLKKTVVFLMGESADLKKKLKLALANFDTSGFSVAEFGKLRERIDTATELLRDAKVTAKKASPVDVQKTLDELNRFSNLAEQKRPENTDLAEDAKEQVMNLRDQIPDLEQRLLAALAQSDASDYTKLKLERLNARISKAINDLGNARTKGAGAGTQIQQTVTMPRPDTDETYAAVINSDEQPTVAAGAVGVITIEQLKDLVSRIEKEHLRLSNLRSTAATITSRIQQLASLKADLGEIITKVEAKQMKLEDVPITPDAAQLFLGQLQNESGTLPPLIVPAGSVPDFIKAPASIAEYAGIPGGEQAVEQLLSAAKDLRWSLEVRLEYDPQLKTRDAMLGRIENIIKNLTMLSVSETPIPPQIHDAYLKELKSMQHNFETDLPNKKGGDVGAMSRLMTEYSRTGQGAPEPSASSVSTAQGAGFGPQDNTFPHGEFSPDVLIRPGFLMNDDQIRHRASAASFIPAAGGPDYKQRALDLCRQVKSAQLGGTKTFGCIENPDEVGPSYDWKGNFTMVCNRLGDSWGSAYPAQFGCPPYDPTAKFSSGF